jgi:hypothetical protein
MQEDDLMYNSHNTMGKMDPGRYTKYNSGFDMMSVRASSGVDRLNRIRETEGFGNNPYAREAKGIRGLVSQAASASKSILKTTSDTIKNMLTRYGEAMSQDFGINKANFVGSILAASSPIFGYFAAKFIESGVFRNFMDGMKKKMFGMLSWLAKKFTLKNIFLAPFRLVNALIKLPFKVIFGLTNFVQSLAKIPFKAMFALTNGIMKIASLPFKAILGAGGGIGGALLGGAMKKIKVPHAAKGGVVSKTGLANVHAGEVIGSIQKVVDGMKRAFTPTNVILLGMQKAIVRQLTKISLGMFGLAGQLRLSFQSALMSGPIGKTFVYMSTLYGLSKKAFGDRLGKLGESLKRQKDPNKKEGFLAGKAKDLIHAIKQLRDPESDFRKKASKTNFRGGLSTMLADLLGITKKSSKKIVDTASDKAKQAKEYMDENGIKATDLVTAKGRRKTGGNLLKKFTGRKTMLGAMVTAPFVAAKKGMNFVKEVRDTTNTSTNKGELTATVVEKAVAAGSEKGSAKEIKHDDKMAASEAKEKKKSWKTFFNPLLQQVKDINDSSKKSKTVWEKLMKWLVLGSMMLIGNIGRLTMAATKFGAGLIKKALFSTSGLIVKAISKLGGFLLKPFKAIGSKVGGLFKGKNAKGIAELENKIAKAKKAGKNTKGLETLLARRKAVEGLAEGGSKVSRLGKLGKYAGKAGKAVGKLGKMSKLPMLFAGVEMIQGAMNAGEMLGKKPGEKLNKKERLAGAMGNMLGGKDEIDPKTGKRKISAMGTAGRAWAGAEAGLAMGGPVGAIVGAISGTLASLIGGNTIAKKLLSLFTKIDTFITNMETTWIGLKTKVSETWDTITNGISSFVEGAKTSWNDYIIKPISGFVDGIKSFGDKIAEFIGPKWMGRLTTAIDYVAKAVEWIIDKIPGVKLAKEGVKAAKSTWGKLKDWATKDTSAEDNAGLMTAEQKKEAEKIKANESYRKRGKPLPYPELEGKSLPTSAPTTTAQQAKSAQQTSPTSSVRPSTVANRAQEGAIQDKSAVHFNIGTGVISSQDPKKLSEAIRDVSSPKPKTVENSLGQASDVKPAPNVKKFKDGGPVPGPVGAPIPAVVHGGEYVLSNQDIQALTKNKGLPNKLSKGKLEKYKNDKSAMAIAEATAGSMQGVNETLVSGFKGLSDVVYQTSSMKVLEEQSKAAQTGLSAGGGGGVGGFLSGIGSSISNIVSSASSSAGNVSKEMSQAMDSALASFKGKYIQMGNSIGEFAGMKGQHPGATQGLKKLNPEFANAINSATLDYKNETGKQVPLGDSYRSIAAQIQARKNKPGLAAKPGRSMHNYGLAVDINSAEANKMSSDGTLGKYGLYRPMSYEPWHVEPIFTKGKHTQIANEGMAQLKASGQQVPAASFGGVVPKTGPIFAEKGEMFLGRPGVRELMQNNLLDSKELAKQQVDNKMMPFESLMKGQNKLFDGFGAAASNMAGTIINSTNSSNSSTNVSSGGGGGGGKSQTPPSPTGKHEDILVAILLGDLQA